jgi:uncharacterized membrane protein
LTAARLLDWITLGTGVALGASLLFASPALVWWERPEHIFLVLLVVIAARLLAAPVTVPALDPRRVLWVGVAAYAVLFSFVTVTRHLTFLTHALDLGYYVQLTWNLAQGRGPYVSLPEMHAWGDHLSPIMYLFVPAFWVAPGALTLLVAQSAILALGALPVFAIAKRRLGDERPAAAFAVLYLLNPSLHGINVRDFHAAALAIPLLLAAMYFAEAGRPWLFALAVALTLTTREDAAIPVAGLGLWLAAAGRWVGGGALALGAFVLLVAETRYLMTSFRGESYGHHLARYSHLGQSVTEIVATVFLHPLRTLGGLLTADRVLYLFAMLAPLAALPVLAPADLLGALPALGENLLSRDPIIYNPRAQYQAFVLPFLIVAAIGGYARVAARRRGRWPVAVLVVAMIASLALASRTVNSFAVARWWPNAEQRAAYTVLARVPPEAAVSAQDPYVAHLSLRPRVFVFPEQIERADYVLLNVSTYPWRNLPGVTMDKEGDIVTVTLAGGRELPYAIAASAGPHLLLRRRWGVRSWRLASPR